MKMKKETAWIVAIVLGLGLAGCGGGADDVTPAQRLVGTWNKACYQPADNPYARYRTEERVFREDGTGSYTKVKYSDAACTQDPYREETRILSYTVGEKTEDSSGKEAYKLDLLKDYGSGPHEDYTMFRFTEEGNLLIAAYSDAYPGDDDASRENYIDTVWHGFAKDTSAAGVATQVQKPQINGNKYIQLYRHIDASSSYAGNLLSIQQSMPNWINVSVALDVKCTDYQYTEADLSSSSTMNNITMKQYMISTPNGSIGGAISTCNEQILEPGHILYGSDTIVQSGN